METLFHCIPIYPNFQCKPRYNKCTHSTDSDEFKPNPSCHNLNPFYLSLDFTNKTAILTIFMCYLPVNRSGTMEFYCSENGCSLTLRTCYIIFCKTQNVKYPQMQKITHKCSSSLNHWVSMWYIISLKLLFHKEVIRLNLAVSALKVKVCKKQNGKWEIREILE